MTAPFTLSIETEPGKSRLYGFHLGTYEYLARQIVEEKFASFVKHGHPVVTVGLMLDGRLFDCYDGQWHSQR